MIWQNGLSLLFGAIAVGLLALAVYLEMTAGGRSSTPNDVAGSSSTMPTTDQPTDSAAPGASTTDQFTITTTEGLSPVAPPVAPPIPPPVAPPVPPPTTSGNFQTGECLNGELPNSTVTVTVQGVDLVDCSDPNAHYRVIQKFPGTTDLSRCDPNPQTQYEFSEEETVNGTPVLQNTYCVVGLGRYAQPN
jgi:hypothetical protein